ncbi:DUF3390 domain-containing protein, partial [Mesorhizobium sp. BR1-1-5]|nr:DUF3390 domain-containing protein [Mesorhizobium sp. BR1-1-5]
LRDEDVQATHAARKALRTDEDAAAGPLARAKAAVESVTPSQMDVAMKGASVVMSSGRRMSLAERGLGLGRVAAGPDRVLGWLPGIAGGWTDERDVPAPPRESFRNWWARHKDETEHRTALDGVAGLDRPEDEQVEEDGR